MGQAVTCVALGIIPDKALWKQIREKLEEEDGLGWCGWKSGLKHEPNAHSSMTDRNSVLGFVVALDGSDDHKCPDARTDIPDLPIGIETECAHRLGTIALAKGWRKWRAFAKWAQKHGVALWQPTLIVTQVEIA